MSTPYRAYRASGPALRVALLATLAAVAGILLIAVAHVPQFHDGATAIVAESPAIAVHATDHGALAAHESMEIAVADATCATCGVDEHDGVAMACALVVMLAVMLFLPRLDRQSWTLRRPVLRVAFAVPVLVTARTPDLTSLGISRT